MRGAVAVLAHFKHHASNHGPVRTIHKDVLNNAVILLCRVIIRVRITQPHMLPMELRLTGAELGRSVQLSKLP